MKCVGMALLLFSVSVHAQTASREGDSRFRTIDVAIGGPIQIPTSAEATQTILFTPGEHVQTIVVSNPSAYQMSVGTAGDSLTVRSTGPVAQAVASVRTDQHQYELELSPTTDDPSKLPLIVSLVWGAKTTNRVTAPPPPPVLLPGVRYSLSGSRNLRPATIGDDGHNTFITWRDDQPLPAVFALRSGKSEEMVNGYVRGGTFVIDRVYQELIFRIDTEVAEARRQTASGSSPHD